MTEDELLLAMLEDLTKVEIVALIPAQFKPELIEKIRAYFKTEKRKLAEYQQQKQHYEDLINEIQKEGTKG